MTRVRKLFVGLVMTWIFSACDSFNAGTQFSSGRQAFLAKKYDEALPYFQKVADDSPGYVYDSFNFRQSIWSYLGRAQYYTGKMTEARQSCERALAANHDEPLARIFFGLAGLQIADDANGVRELTKGLEGLRGWIDYENDHNPSQRMWDPRREIRAEIGNALQTVSDQPTDRRKLFENVEWIGQRMEDEIDQVRRDQSR